MAKASPGFARSAGALLVALALCYGVAALGGWATSTSVDTWYRELTKPAWTPSGRVIGAVWNVLFGLMAVSVWLVWRRRGLRGAPRALALFGAQLVLNLGWSVLFFGLRRPGWAFAELLLLLATIVAVITAFRPISRPAAGLLAPYAAWVAFAGALNLALWRLNA